MSCSAVTLSIATVLSVVAVACLAIGFSTDNWYEIRVDSNKTRLYLQDQQRSSGDLSAHQTLPADYESNYLYYSRDEGLFRVCFAEKKPKEVPTYLSPTQTECFNIDYYIPENKESDGFSDMRWERLPVMCAGAMGLWHAVQFYDHHKLKDEYSYSAWPDVLKHPGVTEFYYGWSYIVAWIGISQLLIAAIIFLSAARCIRTEKRFEQAKNMQYLMPVYPDKRSPYGLNYAYAYPGPYSTAAYAHAGSQYGIGPYAY
ncbi:PREDICTED: uncharacterized protein LOC108376377 [Rhagoletis zephyria]|uniref:uncharacterized protein LOC108376377 n=1 Tax=Rhagoletis zephyria TaxID=28612 RepID=UPI00081197F2|nr:PREDICTED: uncharacterized protein LOC108376377 [Rhagoletis zephyria]